MPNERITESLIRDSLRENGYANIEEQTSADRRVTAALSKASKASGGGGIPVGLSS